jgi:lipoate-protein ligase A
MKIYRTIDKTAKYIMKKDAYLLQHLKDEPVLHFYKWKFDSLTYGYFINIEEYIDLKKAKKKKLNIAKRPTGGGIVFHLWDLAFSFLMPSNNKNFFLKPLDNYKFVNRIILNTISKFLKNGVLLENKKKQTDLKDMKFCMCKPTKYDVIYQDKKIAGASQRKKKNGYLHQASICLVNPDFSYLNEVLLEKKVANLIFLNSYPIFSSSDIEEKRKIVTENLIKSFEKEIS